jgi:hypothetical protein
MVRLPSARTTLPHIVRPTLGIFWCEGRWDDCRSWCTTLRLGTLAQWGQAQEYVPSPHCTSSGTWNVIQLLLTVHMVLTVHHLVPEMSYSSCSQFICIAEATETEMNCCCCTQEMCRGFWHLVTVSILTIRHSDTAIQAAWQSTF